MAQIVIYPTSNGGVAALHPCVECGLTVAEIARKDVPAGTPYFIIDAADLPSGEYRDAWTADFSEPDGYGIGAVAWFAEQAQNNGG